MSNHLVFQVQTETALSTTEAEFIALSEGLRTIIPLIGLMEEMQEQGVGVLHGQADVKCKVFEDNSGALTIATLPKILPHTKYFNTKYLPFREYLEQGKISIHSVSTKDQIADLLTKPLAESKFEKLKMCIMGQERGNVYTNLEGSVRKSDKPMKQESVGSVPKTRENSTSKSDKRAEVKQSRSKKQKATVS